jgi:hypothetical protein
MGAAEFPLFATDEWVVKDFRPIALVSTSKTNTATISHLFIDPSLGRKCYGAESISGLMPSRG